MPVWQIAPDFVWQDVRDLLHPNYLQTLKADGRERERARERPALAYESLLISKNISAEDDTWRYLSCASAFARNSRIFDSIDALHAFYRMPKCLNWRNILSWIPVGSDLDPNSDNVFFFCFKGERIQISQKAGHLRPASETPFDGVSLACWWWPNVECWLGSFWEIQGIRSSIAKNSMFLWFFRWELSSLWIGAWDRTMSTLIEIYWKPILSCASAFARHFAYFL